LWNGFECNTLDVVIFWIFFVTWNYDPTFVRYTFNSKFFKSTFPLVLAYAMAGHKCQGATICSKVLVDVRKAFSFGLTYVMLSRVTKRTHLRIAWGLSLDDFTPVLHHNVRSTIPPTWFHLHTSSKWLSEYMITCTLIRITTLQYMYFQF
jgi:hypothetical protein